MRNSTIQGVSSCHVIPLTNDPVQNFRGSGVPWRNSGYRGTQVANSLCNFHRPVFGPIESRKRV